jgi:phosphate transport system permease protein
MSNGNATTAAVDRQPSAIAQTVESGLRRRHASERRLKLYGLLAIGFALAALCVLLVSVISKGYSAFQQTHVNLEVQFDRDKIDPAGTGKIGDLMRGDYESVARTAIRAAFPGVKGRRDRRALGKVLSSGAGDQLRRMVLDNPKIIGTRQRVWLLASDEIDMLNKGYAKRNPDGSATKVSRKQVAWFDALDKTGAIEKHFNWHFLSSGDSREPEQAGIWGAVVGSGLTMLVTLLLAFPVGVMAAIYLEEFAPKNRWTDLIEVNINNLAAVPSIVFGLLGLAVFLGFFGLPRSAPLIGGLVLALMTLPTLIIAARAALKAVPPSIREAGYGIGASRVQVVMHHVLPLSMPGILTGTIIGMAQALGETAPLLMVGMVAFIVDVPGGITDAATVLPVQVYIWADSPERGFEEKTAAAIMVLLAFLIVMNAIAIFLRKKFERRW